MARTLALLFDGTWQSLSQAEPTSIARLAKAAQTSGPAGDAQLIWYDAGVGIDPASGGRSRRGGAFGAGLETGLFEAYRFLALNARRGDAIILFGFSRGAWAARSLAGWLGACGLPQRGAGVSIADSWIAYRQGAGVAQRVRSANGGPCPVRFLGCFDTVGRLGVPDLIPGVPLDLAINRRRRFHDVRLGAHVETARHACALDETRRIFALTPMQAAHAGQDLQQRWFIGGHGAVGGGEADHRPLADIALNWMAGHAITAGLHIETDALDLKPDPFCALKPPGGVLSWLGRRPRPQALAATRDEMDDSVKMRMAADPGYRPAALG